MGTGITRLQPSPDCARAAYVPVRVAGVLSGTPAQPGGGAFLVVPAWAAGSVPHTLVLITGPRLDDQRLASVVRALIPGAVTTLRSARLGELTGSPLPHGRTPNSASGSSPPPASAW